MNEMLVPLFVVLLSIIFLLRYLRQPGVLSDAAAQGDRSA
jgi:hypothetical protein